MHRRPPRLAFNALAAVSLLLLGVAAVLWYRSFQSAESVSWRGEAGYRSVRATAGFVVVDVTSVPQPGDPATFHGPRYARDEPRPPFDYTKLLCPEADQVYTDWEHAGVVWHGRHSPSRGVLHGMLVVPFSRVTGAATALPAAWLGVAAVGRLRRRRPRREGACAACGYDLRATPDRCPECGLAVAGAAREVLRMAQ